jgi:NADH:ubiquinone reductase (H+-translocating)
MLQNAIPLPSSNKPRVVIIGAGFGGLTLARHLSPADFQIVVLDKNNYHQFQPLFYQVAMSGLEPSSIVFPLRKVFKSDSGVIFRSLEVRSIDSDKKTVETEFGSVHYDILVLAYGADTNFFNNERIAATAIPMKSVSEAIYLRNRILADLERAVNVKDYDERQSWIDIVIVGGGPTGVEIAGALAEMRKYVLPTEYKELNREEIDIYLLDAGDSLLAGMSKEAGIRAEAFLKEMGVIIRKNTLVTDYDGYTVRTRDGQEIVARKLIWAAGVVCPTLPGIPDSAYSRGRRIRVNKYNEIECMNSIYAIGDLAYMESEEWPNGHPQVAQVAIQQGRTLAKNLKRQAQGKAMMPFIYKDLGSMATIGKNKAVADLASWRLSGFFAWIIWLWVHLISLIGVKNKLLVFFNWIISYFRYDPSLRLIIRPRWHKPAHELIPKEKPSNA